MATNINSCSFTGNLVRDVEVKTTKNGTTIAEFDLAVNESVKEGDQWKERPSYLRFVLFGRRAESLSRYLLKGTKVALTASARQDRWEQEGKKRSKIVFKVDQFDFAGSRPSKGTSEQSEKSSESDFEDDFEDDVPF